MAGSNSRPTQRQVPFTVASVLPRTDYKEEENPAEPNSDAYLRTQILILEYLNQHAADELTPAKARFFTKSAGEPNGTTPKQAVQLCYFMRSHGFETYTKLDPGVKRIRLYVANRDAGERRDQDLLYWDQDLVTHEVVQERQLERPSPASQLIAAVRRNAISDILRGA